jgi:hypothetical protein
LPVLGASAAPKQRSLGARGRGGTIDSAAMLIHSRDVLSLKRRAMLSDTLRRLVCVKLDMHLVPHDSLSETDINTRALVEIDESLVQSILVATEQYDREIEIQQVAEQAGGIECAGVDLISERVDVVDAAEEADELQLEDEEDALLDF